MVLTKGVEIIPKRDKVTYATNILGKWEDYSIETYQGKVLKEAAERCKILIKEHNEALLNEEVVSLKLKLSTTDSEEEVVTDDFWVMPIKEETVPAPSELDVKTVTELWEPLPIDDADDDDGKLFVIHAYVNRERQVYLSGWIDSSDWMLSVVPFPTTKSKAVRLINKATKQIEEANKKATIRSRFPSDLKFELVPWIDTAKDELSEEEVVSIAEDMIKQNRERRMSR